VQKGEDQIEHHGKGGIMTGDSMDNRELLLAIYKMLKILTEKSKEVRILAQDNNRNIGG